MIFYFAGMDDLKIMKQYYERTGQRINLMLSFHGLHGMVIEYVKAYKQYAGKIMLDSGAYSVFSKPSLLGNLLINFPLYLENHPEFLKENISHVFSLDYNSDTEKFSLNFDIYKKLYDIYPEISPVIHNIEDDNKELDAYEKFNPKLIGIGQNPKRENDKYRYLLINTINRIIKKAKCHLLGVSELDILKDVMNIDSCDSRSWSIDSYTGYVRCFTVDQNDSRNASEQMIYFRKYESQKTKQSAISFKKMPLDMKNKFLDEMSVNLDLTEPDFKNDNRKLSRYLANIYYTLKKIRWLTVRNVINTSGQ